MTDGHICYHQLPEKTPYYEYQWCGSQDLVIEEASVELKAWCMTGWTGQWQELHLWLVQQWMVQDVRSAATSRQWLLLTKAPKLHFQCLLLIKMSDSSWRRKYLVIINICYKKRERKKENYRVETIQIQKKY